MEFASHYENLQRNVTYTQTQCLSLCVCVYVVYIRMDSPGAYMNERHGLYLSLLPNPMCAYLSMFVCVCECGCVACGAS